MSTMCGSTTVNDYPRMMVAKDPAVVLAFSVKALYTMVPFGISAVASFTQAFMTINLRCRYCKHVLEWHEKRSGEVHPCKVPHLNFRTWKWERCNCQTFEPREKV